MDAGVFEKIEDISGCAFKSIALIDAGTIGQTADTVLLKNSYVTESGNSRTIELLMKNPLDAASSVLFTISMSREQYLSDMNGMYIFALFNSIGCLLGAFLILSILNGYLTKPITRLIRDVKYIDMDQSEQKRLPSEGHDEFSFLRRSINVLLDQIDQGRKSLFNSREELYATLISVGDGVMVVDNAAKIKFMNPVAEDLTGWNVQDAIGQPIEKVFHIIQEYTRSAVESPVDQVLRTDQIVALSNHTLLISKDGTERAIEDTAAPIKNTAGITNGCVLVFKDTSEKKERNRRIEYLSYHDQLTGLYNRRYFELELKRVDVVPNLPLSIIYADVNGLKIINDAFGHESGDKIIQQVSEILTSFSRSSDIVARVGGDEFVLLLPQTDEKETERIVEQFREKTNELYYMDIELSISFGWDTKLEESQSARDVMRNAEDIMYQKKMLSSTSKRNNIIKSILSALHFKCPREEAHSIRVSNLCESIGKVCGLGAEELKELVIAGELHDIGKIAIDESVLNKTELLTKSEWSQIRHHPEVGFRLLGATNEFSNIAEYVLAHHEKWDGTGYPKGLKGTEIDWKARVIAIADSYDAMTCDRPYRMALDPAAAAAEIKRFAGTQYDPDLARVFIEKVLMLEW
jgi:diguanylate cyclase (GGDEF)-like protein/PAS domain S-box-containing protein